VGIMLRDSLQEDVTEALQQLQVCGLLLEVEGAHGRVQQVAVDLVQAHAAYVLQQYTGHLAQSHVILCRQRAQLPQDCDAQVH